jgi:cation:H+ antiporter
MPYTTKSTTQLFGLFAAGGTVIFMAGVTVAQVSDALAQQTGLGASFVGATLVAISTSLPELSTTIAAARLGAYSMAISNIFGSNALMVSLLFVSDVFYREGPILESVDASAIFAAASGVVVTSVYLIGLIERRNKTVGRLGLDSLTVLFVYAGTVLVLYTLR